MRTLTMYRQRCTQLEQDLRECRQRELRAIADKISAQGQRDHWQELYGHLYRITLGREPKSGGYVGRHRKSDLSSLLSRVKNHTVPRPERPPC